MDAKRRELQDQVSRIEFEVRPGKMLRLEASAGAAVFPYDGRTYEALLAEADHAMYRDKAARRRRVAVGHSAGDAEVVAADLFDEPQPAPKLKPATSVR